VEGRELARRASRYDVAAPSELQQESPAHRRAHRAMARTATVPALPATRYARALSLQSAQYATGTALATALQAVLGGRHRRRHDR
jgi:hypothetical protein